MKKACKVIRWILWIFICFILVNLIIWTIKYWGTKAYSKILNEKDWQESMAEFSIIKPKTRVAMFYKDSQENIDTTAEETLLNELDTEASAEVDDIFNVLLSWDTEVIDEENVNRNPYDPDYEDEFNSFFGTSSEETWELIPVQEIENIEDLWDAWFKLDDSTED